MVVTSYCDFVVPLCHNVTVIVLRYVAYVTVLVTVIVLQYVNYVGPICM